MRLLRVLVTGGRHYAFKGRVNRALMHLQRERGIACVIQGECATGADLYAKNWAILNGITLHGITADWRTLGNRAGPIRNQRMIDEQRPDVVLAFPGGKGTADMLKRAVTARLEILNGEEWADRIPEAVPNAGAPPKGARER